MASKTRIHFLNSFSNFKFTGLAVFITFISYYIGLTYPPTSYKIIDMNNTIVENKKTAAFSQPTEEQRKEALMR